MADQDPFQRGQITFKGSKDSTSNAAPDSPDDNIPVATDSPNEFGNLDFGDNKPQPPAPRRRRRPRKTLPQAAPIVPDAKPEDTTPVQKPRRAPASQVRTKTLSTRKPTKKRGLFRREKNADHGQHLLGTVQQTMGRDSNARSVLTFISKKGGVGCSTAVIGVGHILSEMQTVRVLAIDATPDGGDLGDMVVREHNATITDLLAVMDTITEYRHVREFTNQTSSGLEVLAADPNQIDASQLSAEDFKAVISLLQNHFEIILIDTGSDVRSELTRAILDVTDHLIMVTAGASGMRSGIWTANQLASPQGYFQGSYRRLVDGMSTVVNELFPSSTVDTQKVIESFEKIGRKATAVPFSPQIEGGAPIDYAALDSDVRSSFLEVAANVVTTVRAERIAR